MEHDDSLRDIALLAVRGALGASFAAHGMQKLAGWFNGPGPEGTAQFMHSLGFEPADFYAQVVSLNEVVGGALIIAGALGPIGPAIVLAQMASAAGSVHIKNGFWNTDQGIELNTMYALAAILLGIDGYGGLSFDAAVGLRGKSTLLNLVVLAGGVAGGVYALSRRQPPQAPNPQMQQQSYGAPGESGPAD